jgi:dsDNA-specific endonuclease/ATPase MutS2
MSYDWEAHIAEIEAKGDVSRSDWYRLIRGHEDNRREIERKRENEEYKRRKLYNMYENEDQNRADIQAQKEQLMRTSSFNVKSIMPQVKSSVANKEFLSSGNAIQSVIGDSTFSRKGGRRTKRHHGHKKRSGHKRSSKRSGKSRRR